MLCGILTRNWAKHDGCKFRIFDPFEYLYWPEYVLAWLWFLFCFQNLDKSLKIQQIFIEIIEIWYKRRHVRSTYISRKIKFEYHVAWSDSVGAALHYRLALSQQGWLLVARCAMFAYWRLSFEVTDSRKLHLYLLILCPHFCSISAINK